MELSTYPHLSELFKRDVHQKYVDSGCDLHTGLNLVDEFLENHPYYPEALVFKARMLIGIGQDKEALEILDTAKNIDEWRVVYAFDEAEILYRFGQRLEAIQIIRSASEFLLREAIEGVENFLTCIDVWDKKREEILHIIRKEMVRFLSGESTSLNLDTIVPLLQEHIMVEENAIEKQKSSQTEGNDKK